MGKIIVSKSMNIFTGHPHKSGVILTRKVAATLKNLHVLE